MVCAALTNSRDDVVKSYISAVTTCTPERALSFVATNVAMTNWTLPQTQALLQLHKCHMFSQQHMERRTVLLRSVLGDSPAQ
mmetsp:Transcript_56971/g.68184  ORF Transcript_56971/g.68184 Transcript_56971/m.68184 type:complete len:82 (+) Transcript_56971:137-382(+)